MRKKLLAYAISSLVLPLSLYSQCDTVVADFSSTAPACAGEGVDFINTGSSYGGLTYFWDFGSGASPATSTAENPSGVVYSTSGLKSVTLTINDATLGCVSSKTLGITIHPQPTASFSSTAPACVGSPVDFTNTGSTGTGWVFSWDFGSGSSPATSSAENPSGITFSTSGTKTITFTITDGSGNCSDTYTATIDILQTPVADFASTTPACTGEAVSFSNAGSSGANFSYSWNFGSGASPATSTSENPAGIVYSTAGNKSVTLITTHTVTGCTDTMVKPVTINQTPTATFSSTAPQCAGEPVDFANTGSTGATWSFSWDFGSGASPSVSTSENPQGIVYSTGGTKTVTFTISSGNCSATTTGNITINNRPEADFTSTAPGCTGIGVDFSNTGSTGAGISFTWDFGPDATPATSTTENPADVVFSAPGNKQVTLVVTNASCTDSISKSLTIHETPTVSFVSTAPQCAGSPVNFMNTGSTGTQWSYAWDFGVDANPATSNAENPDGVVYSSGGTKTVTLTISNGFCTNTSSSTISIENRPLVDAGPDTTICANRSVQIGTPAITGLQYSWSPVSTLDDPTLAQPTASPVATFTTYYVTVTDPVSSCRNTDSVTVTMVTSALVNAGEDAEICAGDSVQIGAALLEGQTYRWEPATGLSDPTSPNPIASPTETTLYTLKASYRGCDTITDQVLVTVNPLPDADAGEDVTITRGDQTQLTATGGVMYEWSPSAGLNNPGISTPTASPDTTTSYVVEVTDLKGCVNSDTVTVTVIEPDFWAPTAFTPNDDNHNDIFFIRTKGSVDFELRVFDRWGAVVFSSSDPEEGWNGRKQGSGERMPAGAYVYHVKGEFTSGEQFTQQGLINLIR